MLALGFAEFPGFALRVDILERIAARIRAQARSSATFDVPPALAAEAGLGRDELAVLVEALGFRPAPGAGHRVLQPDAAARGGTPARARAPPRRTRRLAVRGAGPAPGGDLNGAPAVRLDKWLCYARFIRNRNLAEALVAARRVRLNEQIVGKTHQLVRPGDVITLTEPARVRVVRVRALGERRGPAVEAAALTRSSAGWTEPYFATLAK